MDRRSVGAARLRHGPRWYGGFNIAANYAEVGREEKTLLRTCMRVDCDGPCFLARTRAATPRGVRVLAPR